MKFERKEIEVAGFYWVKYGLDDDPIYSAVYMHEGPCYVEVGDRIPYPNE